MNVVFDSAYSTTGNVVFSSAYSTGAEPIVEPKVVTSVGVPTAGWYTAGNTLSFTVNFDGPVNVSGAPVLTLNVGEVLEQADYISGSGTSALVFNYVVQTGDVDKTGIVVGNINLNGGVISSEGEDATLKLNGVGDTSGVLVDAVKPVLDINGPNPLIVQQHSTFSDPGASSSEDGTVTATGNIDTSVLGDQTVSYDTTDPAGNSADTVTRVVRIVEAVAGNLAGKAIKRSIKSNTKTTLRY